MSLRKPRLLMTMGPRLSLRSLGIRSRSTTWRRMVSERHSSHTVRKDFNGTCRAVSRRRKLSCSESTFATPPEVKLIDPRHCKLLRTETGKIVPHVEPLTLRHVRSDIQPGARLTNLYVYDKNGDWRDVTLGYDDGAQYLVDTIENRTFFGAVVGRYANR